MARSKKPRKPYQRGKVLAGGHIPMAKSRADQYETLVLMAMEGLTHGFLSYDQAVELALFVTAVSHVKCLPTEYPPIITKATKALSSIHDRYGRTGKWGASGDDLRALEESIPTLLGYFKSLPSSEVVDATLSATNRFFK